MSERRVTVDQLPDGRFVIETYSRTVDLARMMDGAPLILPPDSGVGEVGRGILDGLNRSHHHMPPRATITKPDADFLGALRVSSFGAYMPGVRSVGVYADYDEPDGLTQFELTPKANEGPRGGFTPIVELIRAVPYESPEQLGHDVLAALEQATV